MTNKRKIPSEKREYRKRNIAHQRLRNTTVPNIGDDLWTMNKTYYVSVFDVNPDL